MRSLLRRYGATVFGLALLLGALYVVQREFHHLSWKDVRQAMDAMPPIRLWSAFGWTLLAYAVLTIYDRLGSVYAGYPVSYARTSLASFCAYTLAHNLGVAAVSGAAVRFRFYAAWGLPPAAIAKVVAFTSLTFGLGGFFLGGLVLLMEPEVLPWVGEHTPHWVMRGIGLLMWALVATYVVLSKVWPHFTLFKHRIDLPGFRMALAQTALASVDVAVTAAIFYALLPEAEGLTFIKFLGIYVAGYTAGLAASVPGGIGVFDGFILIALQPYVAGPEVISALLLFRIYYYIVPLFIAGGLFAGFEITQRKHMLGWLSKEQRVTDAFEVPALASLVALSGVALIFIGALPPKHSPLHDPGLLDLVAGAATHFAASVVGSLMLAVAYGMLRRLRVAWWAGLLLLANGALICWLRGEPWWLTAGFGLVGLLVAVVPSAFYRAARLTGEPLSGSTTVSAAAGVVCAFTLALVAYRGPVGDEAWWSVVFSGAAPLSLRFGVGLAGLMLLVAVLRLLRPARIAAAAYDDLARLRLNALAPPPGASLPETADGVLFAEGDKAGLPFLRQEGVWLALGDPVGEPAARIALIWRFRDLCEREGVDPAFWGVGEDLLRVYGDIGLTAFPLPVEAGPPRHLACRAERDLDRFRDLMPAPRG